MEFKKLFDISELPIGYKTVLYNILIFFIACIALYLVKIKPDYKIFLVIVFVGIIFINIHSMMRYYWYSRSKEKEENQQRRNIVPDHCPDYWNKIHTEDGIKCENKFIEIPDLADEDEIRTIQLGDEKTEPYFYLEAVAKMSNQDKCNKFSTQNIPWLDLTTKCEASGV
jgi:hypothetical protein